jgi:hypothetical protein
MPSEPQPDDAYGYLDTDLGERYYKDSKDL